MRRIFVVYSPNSSHYDLVKKEIIEPIKKFRGVMVGKYEIQPTSVNQNAKNLASLLQDEDLVVIAGGDGTASVGINAVLFSKKDVTLAVFGYGNFNDFNRVIGLKDFRKLAEEKQEIIKFYPLEIEVNGSLWRYAGCYVTIGFLAESTKVFENKKIRKNLKNDRQKLIFSLRTLAGWYLKNRKKQRFLPEFTVNGREIEKSTTDYLAINSETVARIMRSRSWFKKKKIFYSTTANLKTLPRLLKFMTRSITQEIRGEETTEDIITFRELTQIAIQAEGEYQKLKDVQRIKIKKAETYLKILA